VPLAQDSVWNAQINTSMWYEVRELAMLPNKHKGQTTSALLKLTASSSQTEEEPDWNRFAVMCPCNAAVEIRCHRCVQKPRGFLPCMLRTSDAVVFHTEGRGATNQSDVTQLYC